MHAELVAAKHVIEISHGRGWTNIWIESDSLITLSSILATLLWSLGPFITNGKLFEAFPRL